MWIHNMALKLAERFTPMSTQEVDQMQRDANEWWSNIDPNAEGVQPKVKKYASLWYVRLAVAFLYIYLVREIQDFLNPSETPDEKHD